MNHTNIPSELIKQHYTLMSMSILKTAQVEGIPVETIVKRLVGMFGLVPLANDVTRYEIIPQLRKIADEAAAAGQAPALPETFTEDEAVLFCACQTALLEVQGKLGEMNEKLQEHVDNVKAQKQGAGQSAPTASKQGNDAAAPKKPGSGPTYH